MEKKKTGSEDAGKYPSGMGVRGRSRESKIRKREENLKREKKPRTLLPRK